MRISDWSSDVCSSDLIAIEETCRGHIGPEPAGKGSRRSVSARRRRAIDDPDRHPRFLGRMVRAVQADRKSVVEGKSVSVRVDLGVRRLIKKKTHDDEAISI